MKVQALTAMKDHFNCVPFACQDLSDNLLHLQGNEWLQISFIKNNSKFKSSTRSCGPKFD